MSIPPDYGEVRPPVRDWLEDLRPDEVEALKGLIKLAGEVGIDRLRHGAKLADQVETVGKFTRWAAIGMMGLFVASITLAEQIGKVVTFIRGSVK